MKVYKGKRINGLPDVRVDGVPLNPRLDLWKHSVTGFEWGDTGGGSAQLALALLADSIGDDDEAEHLHRDFLAAVAAGLPHAGWTLTEEDIRETLNAMEND